ncbi:MAG TPA: TetR/AcrR family transcriptional regulator [Polyangiaceae bacterium]|nr:TetR/AcrR family transcriptional regulator [Polyangiaceae bacterium]
MEPKTQKSRATRERLRREAAQLFSVKGYFLTTVDDVMNRVALTKGGFYAHFSSKEELGRAVIDYATELWAARVIEHVMKWRDPRGQLRELLEGYRLYAVDRTFAGGCFFVNLAIEMDDQHDEFRGLIEQRFDQFRMLVVSIVETGKGTGHFRADTPSAGLAVAIVAYLTGTMMLAKTSKSFELFREGNPVMTTLIASFETDAPIADS